MRFLGWNTVLSAWLLVSAFLFPHTPSSTALTAITAFLVPLFAYLATARPTARFVITALAALLGVTALLLPGISTSAAVNNAIVGTILFALSAVRPTHATPPVAPPVGQREATGAAKP